ncbi:hypothetical protein FDECE_14834 [Fusarium decemcellulare]|nr:hypothetical protein FDECE_14834 [Fusarium decemcellulare]
MQGGIGVAVVTLIAYRTANTNNTENNKYTKYTKHQNTSTSTTAMANATVTPAMRAAGWNITFSVGHNPFQFAGLFQPEGSDLVTFRDVVDELRLCFELPDAVSRNERDDADSNLNSWDDISFALTSRPSTLGSARAIPSFVAEPDRDQLVPSLPPRTPKQPNIAMYHLVRHKRCSLSTDAPLTEHLRGSSNQATGLIYAKPS